MQRKLVIDISHWNGDIDLAAWKAKHNLWGVIIKAGGYENLKEGGWQQYRDSKFEADYAKAKAAGLHVGAYYYDATTSVAQAKKNAAHFLALVKGKAFDLPCYMDVEESAQLNLAKRTLTDIIKAFCDAVKAGGRYAGLYTGGSAWMNNVYNAELFQYADWIAAWRASWPTYAGDIGMWQQGSMSYATGAIAYRWVSGYVDVDWCVVDYPSRIKSGETGTPAAAPASKPASTATSDTKLSVAERSAQTAEHIAKHDVHGYSQYNRMGYGSETITFTDKTTFIIHLGDYDCSEMARVCANAGLGIGAINYMWSGDADAKLKAAGFKRIPFSTATVKRGDILWKTGHMGIALGNGRQADAHGDEVGGITGPRQGDQTTHEIEVRDLRTNWVYIYRHEGMPKPKQQPGKAANDYGLHYRAHCETAGWFNSVHDGQVAGTVGYGKRLEAIKITPPEGVELEVLLHIQGIGDKVWRGIRKGKSSGTGSSSNDPIMGTVGKGKRIEGISVEVSKNTNAKLKGKTLYYRVHVQKQGWTKWVKAGTYAGTRGKALRVEAIQIKFQ